MLSYFFLGYFKGELVGWVGIDLIGIYVSYTVLRVLIGMRRSLSLIVYCLLTKKVCLN